MDTSMLFIESASAFTSFAALFKAYHCAHKYKKLTLKVAELRRQLEELSWHDRMPDVVCNYFFNKAREHQYEIEIVNTLGTTITLIDLAMPSGGKISYSDLSFPQDKNTRHERMSYNDKISLQCIKTPIGRELAASQRLVIRYSIKFNEMVFTGKRPDLVLSYNSPRHPEARKLRIGQQEKPAAAATVANKNASAL